MEGSSRKIDVLHMQNVTRSTLYTCRTCTAATKVMLFKSLVVSILLYGSELWVQVPRVRLRKVAGFIMESRRWILREPRFPRPGFRVKGGLELRISCGMPSLEWMLLQRRLAYLVSLLRVPCPSVAALETPPTGEAPGPRALEGATAPAGAHA